MGYQTDPAMQECIDACMECHADCLHTSMTYCLDMGGAHVGAGHLRLMLNCAELCQVAANFMLSDSALHAVACKACAEVCSACADSCDQVGDMDECAALCRRCASACAAMGAGVMPGRDVEAAAQMAH